MRINNNDDSDIKTRLNVSGSTIETLKDTVSRINDDQIENGGGNNNSGGNKNGVNNAHNGNGGGNNRSNGGNFRGSARRGG